MITRGILAIALACVVAIAIRVVAVVAERQRAVAFAESLATKNSCDPMVTDNDVVQNYLLGGSFKFSLACATGPHDIYVGCNESECFGEAW